MTEIETFLALPLGVKIWLVWLLGLQLSSLFFLRRPQARWVLWALGANVIGMRLLHTEFGPGTHMGIPHLLFWSPLLVLLARSICRLPGERLLYRIWLCLLSASIAVSLGIDYYKTAKWLLGS